MKKKREFDISDSEESDSDKVKEKLERSAEVKELGL